MWVILGGDLQVVLPDNGTRHPRLYCKANGLLAESFKKGLQSNSRYWMEWGDIIPK